MSADNYQLWPEDKDIDQSISTDISNNDPDIDLAILLISTGCSLTTIKDKCKFQSIKAVRSFIQQIDVREHVRSLRRERVDRVGDRAIVRLERLLAQEHFTDIRALVAAIRAGLDLAGLTRGRETSVPIRQVHELSVPELNALIASTERELQTRIARPLPVAASKD